jgi:2,4-dienoyl-CoA reductase-like NADH-dependent reductase (Old Yellow Enzyme family)
MNRSIFDPVRFPCGAVSANGYMLAALTNGQSHDDGTLADAERRWLVRRAAGGFGVVSTCAAHVSEEGKGFDGQLGVWGDHQLPGLTSLAADLTKHGTLPIVQLYHGGARCPSKLTGAQPWSASAFTEEKPGFEVPRAATDAEVTAVIARFSEAAVRTRAAGFAGVELHGAHGYLLSQFLSATMNTRDDRWGGSLENRARLVREVTRAARKEGGDGFLVGVRLSPEDFGFAHGLDLDETVQVARWLADDGADFIHLSLWDVTRMTKKRPDAHAINVFRAALPADVRIVVAGKVWTRADAERCLALGADMVALGRAGILNPALPHAVRDDAWTPRRPPLTPEEYAERDVSPAFLTYLRRFDGMVAG